jgi:hypothetical protein
MRGRIVRNGVFTAATRLHAMRHRDADAAVGAGPAAGAWHSDPSRGIIPHARRYVVRYAVAGVAREVS